MTRLVIIPLLIVGALALVQCAATIPIGNINVLEVPAYQLLARYNEIKRSQPWLTLLPTNYGEILPQEQEDGFNYRGLRGKRHVNRAQLDVHKHTDDSILPKKP